jgi:uncharacterized membrane protein YdjX (TVP38/TMEM64 family)
MSNGARGVYIRLALLLGAVGLVLAARQMGLLGFLEQPQLAKLALQNLGWFGVVAYVACYTLLQPFGVPGTLFFLLAPLVWPMPMAYLASMLGTMGASLVGFYFARFLARDWVADRTPETFAWYQRVLEKQPLLTVF